MIASMTGFARQPMTLDEGAYDWELKSVNHRYLELRIHLPEALRALEPEVRSRLKKHLARGKIDVVLRDRGQSGASPTAFDADRVRSLIDATESIADIMKHDASVSPLDILAWPGVLEGAKVDPDRLAAPVLAGLDTAIDALVAMRETEGQELANGLRERLEAVAEHVGFIRERREPMLAEQRERTLARINELDLSLDPKRLEQEVALLAQRLDIAEELDRIEGHVKAVRDILTNDGPSGRRLDFLMQEFNRETNTLASKSHDLEITRATVEMKVLIEQMREQVQNLE
ncbi:MULTISPECIES: YicC/YloC family endoribonuclease [unclassified Thioalkalivibrio]|uniref:YicC/YloC family endoribonuclease n=1 Tax=unclassified Thioalkalivibrio TaxID=2621013 RepID=UPI00035E0816|nr:MULTISPECIES: YicC/YloC family endoribonuclease [unclassified Thioalkalivibrio]